MGLSLSRWQPQHPAALLSSFTCYILTAHCFIYALSVFYGSTPKEQLTVAPNKALNLLFTHIISILDKKNKNIYFKMTYRIVVTERGKKVLPPLFWKKSGVCVWGAGMKLESLGNMVIGWGLNTNTLVQFTRAKSLMQKNIHLNYMSHITFIHFFKLLGFFFVFFLITSLSSSC